MDQETAEPTLEDVEAEFPRWHTWRGISGLVYASRGAEPAAVRGEDPLDLERPDQGMGRPTRLSGRTPAKREPAPRRARNANRA